MSSTLGHDRARLRVLTQTILRFRRRGARSHIRNLLRKQHPADMAQVLLELPKTIRGEVLMLVGSAELKADILSELDPDAAGEVLGQLDSEDAVVRIFEEMSQDDAATLLRALPEERRAGILGRMGAEESEGVEGLLTYRPETAGAMMTTEVFALREDLKVEAAIRALREAREAREAETVFYIYVTNDLEQLVGVISLRQLLVSDSDSTLGALMERDVIAVATDTDREQVARLVEHYNFIAVPVVDGQRHLLGIITVDDVLDVLREEATEDLMRLSGAGDVPVRGATIVERIPGRTLWLVGAGLSSLTLALVTDSMIWESVTPVLSEGRLWLMLLPMLLLMSITGTIQSSAVAVAAVTAEALPSEKVFPYLIREVGANLLMALIFGTVAGAGAWVILGEDLGVLMAGALTLGVSISMTMGSVVPLMLHRFHRDPTELPGVLLVSLASTVAVVLTLYILNLVL